MQLAVPISESLKGKVEGYTFEVGILKDSKHKPAKRHSFKTLAGGPATRTKAGAGLKVSQVSKQVRGLLGFNYLTKPFEKKKSDAVKLLRDFFKIAFGSRRTNLKRLDNLVQAVVRNPILRGDYGKNTRA